MAKNTLISVLIVGCVYSGIVSSNTTEKSLPDAPTPEQIDLWQAALQKSPPTSVGCWHSEYPNRNWVEEKCLEPPHEMVSPSVQGKRPGAGGYNTGNGTDYSAETTQPTRSATGSFSDVKGFTSVYSTGEHEGSTKLPNNSYSLQINTNFSEPDHKPGNTSPFCQRNKLSKCVTWQQFIYISEGDTLPPARHPTWEPRHIAFIENWLYIPVTESCPAGWKDFDPGETGATIRNCTQDSGKVGTPVIMAAERLDQMKLTGVASSQGTDAVMLFNGPFAYAASQSGNTLDTGSTWRHSEFNIFGSSFPFNIATFNPGSSITTHLTVNDGTNTAPVCRGPEHGGTTGEGNNLTLGKCIASGGEKPSIEFTQFN
jgi:hypothetical protein